MEVLIFLHLNGPFDLIGPPTYGCQMRSNGGIGPIFYVGKSRKI